MSRYQVGKDISHIRRTTDLGPIAVWIFVALIIIGFVILVSSIPGPVYSDVVGGKGV